MRTFWVLLALVLLIIPVSATHLTFQNNANYLIARGNLDSGSWTYAGGTGGNSYVSMGAAPAGFGGYSLSGAYPSTYCAATILSNTQRGAGFGFYNAGGGLIAYTSTDANVGTGRLEVVISGTTARTYRDGVLIATDTVNPSPNFIAIGGISSGGFAAVVSFDDYVYPNTENTHIFSVPNQAFVIQKDVIGAAGSGLAFSNNATVVQTTTMTTRYGRSALTDGLLNETVVLRNHDTQTPYLTNYLPIGAYSGTLSWNLTEFFASSAPYGLYEIAIPGSSGSASDTILYTATGAVVTWDRDAYATGDTASIAYTVTAPTYWNTGSYTYRMDVIDSYGNTISTTPLSTNSGTVSVTFTSANYVGTYYAVIIATPIAGGSGIWLAYDYTTLDAYAGFNGYVNDAETATVIVGANVSFVQGSTISNSITGASGSYAVPGLGTGVALSLNVTASGHHQYYATFTPQIARSNISLNITLNSTSPAYSGRSIGGVARDGEWTAPFNLSNGYGRPIAGATVFVRDTIYGVTFNRTTNNAGWYMCSETESCMLTGKIMDVWGTKTGYNNSVNHTVIFS